jgi:tRNA modification GTPase
LAVTEPPTWVACLTPPGRGALATLGLFGPRAWEVARALFRPRRGELPATPLPGTFWLGRLGGEVADEVVLAVKRVDPHSWLEVHGHGGPEVVRFLTGLLADHGLRPCTWQEFLHRTGEDPLTALAAAALAEAPTACTARILLDQHTGALGRALDAVLAALDAGDMADVARQLDEMARWTPLGLHLTRPWRVVVAGAPNVGKSSLVNVLAGYQRSIVAATPGTTRDVVTTALAFDGWPVELADTAGIRAGAGELEQAGIHRARTAAAGADLCLWLLDASVEPAWPDERVGAVRLVVNKIDLPPAWDLGRAADAIHVSAATGEGVPDLCAALSGWLVPAAPPPGAAVPFTAELTDRIDQVRRSLGDGDAVEARRVLSSLRRPNEPPAQLPVPRQ